jgi:RNA polymerase sigma-70 factor (ECF subfamily)
MPEPTTVNESSLVLQAQRGDLKSFSALVEIYQGRAVTVAYSFLGNFEDARDLAQEAFIKAHEKLSSFKAESRFYTWFYRILANLCKDFLRKKKVRKAISFFAGGRDEEDGEDMFARVPSPAKNAGAILVNEELGEKIFRAMDRLPFQQKSVFALRYLDGLSMAEIAESLNISEGAVKAHLWQAGQKMKKSLGAYLQPEGRDPK